jgi:hypothetical protein
MALLGDQVKVKVTLQLTVSVIMSRYPAHSGTCDQILLSFRRFFLKFAVLSLWDALYDERSGLSFVFLSLVSYHYLHQPFTVHVFYSSAIYIQ